MTVTEDLDKLKRTALNAWAVDDRVEAVKKIQDQDFLLKLVLHDLSGKVRQVALDNLEDESHLILVAMRSKYEPLRSKAIAKIHSEDALLKIIDETEFPTSRRFAFEKLKENKSLVKVAIQEGGWIAKNAITKINEVESLLEIATLSKDVSTKWVAIKKIAQLDPNAQLQKIYFQIARSPIFPIEDRINAAKLIKSSDILLKLIEDISKEVMDKKNDFKSVELDIGLSDFLTQILKQISPELVLQVAKDTNLPKIVRKLALSHIDPVDTLVEFIKSNPSLLIPAFVTLVNEKKNYEVALELFVGLPVKKKLEVIRSPLKSTFRENLFQIENSIEMKIAILESFQSPEQVNRILESTSTDVLAKLKQRSASTSWINELIDVQLQKTTSINFQTAEEAFTYLKDNLETPHIEDILQFLVGSPYLLKVFELPVSIGVKKKVIELVPDPVDLQILLLTLPDGEIKNLIRSRLES